MLHNLREGESSMKQLAAKTHDAVSVRLLVPFSRIRRSALTRSRPTIKAYREGIRFRRESAGWDRSRKTQWILDRVRFVVRRAYEDTEYYRDLFDAAGFDPYSKFGFDDFGRLPVLEREDVHDAGRRLLSTRIPAELLVRDATGGSTGKPTEVWRGPEERGWNISGSDYCMSLMGVPPGTRTAFLWGHHLDPLATETLRERYQAFETNSRYFDCLRLSPQVLENYHRSFERLRPACIVAYASALGHLAEHILERGYRPSYPTRCLITGAEKLIARHREAAEQVFGLPVHERYGSRDVGFIGFQFQPNLDRYYHIEWANILVEPETRDVVSSILVTKLHADGMPMIRYRIGDLGRFLSGSKPGHPAFIIKDVIGRQSDRIWLQDGRWVQGVEVPHLMKDYPVREYLFFQRSDFSIDISIVPKSGFSESHRNSIAATVQANLPGLPIRVALVDEIPHTRASKWRLVMSEVNRVAGATV